MFSQAIANFGVSMGMNGLTLNPSGKLRLKIEGVGEISILHQTPRVMLGISRETRLYERPKAHLVLAQTDFRRRWPEAVYAQRRGDRTGYAVILEDTVDAAGLSQWVDRLTGLLEALI